MSKQGWDWIEQSEFGGSTGSTLSKLSKNQKFTGAQQLAREVIQNSWDAAQGYRSLKGHEFRVEFNFIELDEQKASEIRAAMQLTDLGQGLSQDIGLETEKMKLVTGSGSAKMLVVEDFGAHGLYGHPSLRKQSVLFRALYQTGSTSKDKSDAVSGGSFGFGKSAFISASASNTVFAYSCFDRYAGDPATRRFVGWSWHDEFEKNGLDYDGRAIFGEFKQLDSGKKNTVTPFEDTKADQLAETFGLQSRDYEELNSRGTSLVILDPVVDPSDLLEAVEENWWPAIVDPKINLHVVVNDYGGRTLHPQPKARNELQPLIRAYEIATNSSATLTKTERREEIKGTDSFSDIGSIALVAKFPEDPGQAKQVPKTALIRGPRMVIGPSQHAFQAKNVEIAGVVVTNEENHAVDGALRKTEPYAHDIWNYEGSGENSEETALARKIQQQFVNSINDFGRKMAADAPAVQRNLASFNRVFGKFFGDSQGPPSGVEGEYLPIEIRIQKKVVEQQPNGQIRLFSSFSLFATEDSNFNEEPVLLDPKIVTVLDESSAGEEVPFTLKMLSSSRTSETAPLKVNISAGDKLKFEITSDSYDPNFTVDFKVSVTKIAEKDEGVED